MIIITMKHLLTSKIPNSTRRAKKKEDMYVLVLPPADVHLQMHSWQKLTKLHKKGINGSHHPEHLF